MYLGSCHRQLTNHSKVSQIAMAQAVPSSGDPLAAGNRYEEYVRGEIR